jgi:Flp pilus assembly protein TadB
VQQFRCTGANPELKELLSNSRRGLQFALRREPEQLWLWEVSMFLTLAIILAVIWLILWLAVHITSGLIHILIALAVISFIVHLFRGRPATT